MVLLTSVVAIFNKLLIVKAMDLFKNVPLIMDALDVIIIHHVYHAFHRNNLLIYLKIVSIVQNIVKVVHQNLIVKPVLQIIIIWIQEYVNNVNLLAYNAIHNIIA